MNTHLLKVGGLGFWGAEVWPYLGLCPPVGCKVSVKMLCGHVKHPVPSVIEWNTARGLSLKGAAVMTCPHCVASSSVEPCHCDATFRLGLRVPPMQERGGSEAPDHACHTGGLELYSGGSDRSGGGEGHRGESNRPLAPWHPPPCWPVIPCSRGMIICMTEPGAFAASDYDSPWQQAFF